MRHIRTFKVSKSHLLVKNWLNIYSTKCGDFLDSLDPLWVQYDRHKMCTVLAALKKIEHFPEQQGQENIAINTREETYTEGVPKKRRELYIVF